jgi:hypothetical protein
VKSNERKRNRVAAGRGTRQGVRAAIEALEGRQLLAGDGGVAAPLVVGVSNGVGGPAAVTPVNGASIRVSRGALVMNAVRGATSVAGKLTVSNAGPGPLSVTGLSVGGTEGGSFQVSNAGGLPGVLDVGASATVSVVYKPGASTALGIHAATLSIASTDPAAPSIVVALRGLATAGTGGQNEPSLQRVFDLYQLGVATGDKNAGDTNLFSPSAPLGATDEVAVQRLVKAGAGAVTIQPLASFAAGTPVSQVGWYPAGNRSASARTEVLSVDTPEAQSVNVTPVGSTEFDPGAAPFGLYATFPIFANTAYSEDDLNPDEQTVNNRRKVRFYPLKNADGSVVPSAFVFTSEDFFNDSTGGYDTNDFIGIVRNVRVAPTNGGGLTVTNLDGAASADDLLSFNRISIQPPAPRVDSITGEVTQPPDNVVHDTATVRLTNNRPGPLVIMGLALTNRTAWQVTDGPAAGTVLAPGASTTVTLKFIAGQAPTTTTNETIDVTGRAGPFNGTIFGSLVVLTSDPAANRTVGLRGYFQFKNEDEQEPSLGTLVNKIYGYGTQALAPGQVLNGGGKVAAVGEEILSPYWLRADATRAVTVRQLAAYHTQGNTATLKWFDKPTKTQKTVIIEEGVDGQSLLPRKTSGAAGGGTFNPGAAQFGFRIDNEWSDDKLNPQEQSGGGFGHHVRFYPARDAKGNLIPGTFLFGMDYQSINFDYQDNVYVVTNVKPATGQAIDTSTAPTLANIMLVDAATDADLGVFGNGTVIDLSGGKQYTVEANPGTGTLGSVVFRIDGAVERVETTPPYTIAGDAGTDHNPWTVPAGAHTLTVTPFSGANGTGIAGPTITATFSTSGSTEPDPTFGVTSLTLVNAVTNADIKPLTDGTTIDFSGGKKYSVRADVAGATASVTFRLDGAVERTESSAPFTIAGDDNPVAGTNQTDYLPWTTTNGDHVLSAQGFAAANGAGTPGSVVSLNIIVTGVGAAAGAGTFTGTNIGGATGSTAAGSAVGSWTVKGSGTGIAGASDKFHFANQSRSGNFDVKVKLNTLTANGTAGLVARGATSAGNSGVALLFKGGTVTFGSRQSFGGDFTSAAVATGTAGTLWLRLRRVGSVFTAFTGTNGTDWTSVGTATVSSLPDGLLFGFGVFSGGTTQATAGFTGAQG